MPRLRFITRNVTLGKIIEAGEQIEIRLITD